MSIEEKRAEIERKHGKWTAHNIWLKDDIYTFSKSDDRFQKTMNGHGAHLERIVQVAADIAGKPLSSLRVLDLGCLEGLYAIEFARRGAEAVGIEGRQDNIVKAQFAADSIGLPNVTFFQDDVRNLSVDKYGKFDVVISLGLLYHLDAPDVFVHTQQTSDVCTRVLILDTHVTSKSTEIQTWRGRDYYGTGFHEHDEHMTAEQRLKNLWASLDNPRSFWPTYGSMYNLLNDVGFTSVYTCAMPGMLGQLEDRETFVAIKGEAQKLVSTPNHSPKIRARDDGRSIFARTATKIEKGIASIRHRYGAK